METLRDYRSRPALIPLNLSQVPVSVVVSRYKEYQSNLHKWGLKDKVNPSTAAYDFYGRNAVVAEIYRALHEDEPLGQYKGLLDEYQVICQMVGLRAFYYLLLIITRESRHDHNVSEDYEGAYRAKYGDVMVDYHHSLRPHDEVQAVNYFLGNQPNVSMATYTGYMTEMFYNGPWGGSVGGKRWSRIADTLRRFVIGETSMEMMLDTVFTLAHNCAPIFNKGYLFRDQDIHSLAYVLNAQHMGVVPQVIMHRDNLNEIPAELRTYVKTAETFFPGKFSGSLPLISTSLPQPKDWYLDIVPPGTCDWKINTVEYVVEETISPPITTPTGIAAAPGEAIKIDGPSWL